MNKKIWILAAAVLLALSLCACGGSTSTGTSQSGTATEEEKAPTAAETAETVTQDSSVNVVENPDLDSYSCTSVAELEEASGIPMPIDGDVSIFSCYNMKDEKPAVAIVNFSWDGHNFCYAGSEKMKIDSLKEDSEKTMDVDGTEIYISPVEDSAYGFRASWEAEDGTVHYLYYAQDLSEDQLNTVLGNLM